MEDWLDESNVSNKTILKYFGVALLVIIGITVAYVYSIDKTYPEDFVPTFERIPITNPEIDDISIEHIPDGVLHFRNDGTLLYGFYEEDSVLKVTQWHLNNPYDIAYADEIQSVIIAHPDITTDDISKFSISTDGKYFQIADFVWHCPEPHNLGSCEEER